ncbi:hypothetical protein [Paraferrimonas haliotis]|uniref:Uncharacterized protein n=1 Tax=Paraferrimonas haliotis TaxID=2013866 RepID=A0AA37TTS4_9GAMM|nr:hypothetical protein [Paraferrimonas haliotis]GLS82809.1 hypothetical protein GCM10007894_07860 [Paraferrimonas haliotis]
MISLPSAQLNLTNNSGLVEARYQLRLPDIAQSFNGLSLAQLIARVNLIYRQCPEAQSWAASSLALGDCSPELYRVREQALALEWLSEHSWQMWRLAHDWLGPDKARMQLLSRWRAELLSRKQALPDKRWLVNDRVQACSLAPLLDWQQQWRELVYQPLLEQSESDQLNGLFQPEFEAVARYETGSLVRVGGADGSFSARLTSLWDEAWLASAALCDSGVLPELNPVRGLVKAARGQLQHSGHWRNQASLKAGQQVSDYRIEIPTKSILQSLCHSLSGLEWSSLFANQLLLNQWLLSHSPCLEVNVQWSSEVTDSNTKLG